MALILWLLGIILIVLGVWKLVQKDFLLGIVFILLGLLLGPGSSILLL